MRDDCSSCEWRNDHGSEVGDRRVSRKRSDVHGQGAREFRRIRRLGAIHRIRSGRPVRHEQLKGRKSASGPGNSGARVGSERVLIMGYIALNADDDARFYGLGAKGVGHVLIIPKGYQGDPLASGGEIEKACPGKGLDAARLSERFTGDAMCKRCAAWLVTDGGRNDLEAAREDKHAPEMQEAVRELIADTAPAVRPLTREDVREAVEASREGAAARKRGAARDKRQAAIAVERERLAAQKKVQAERAPKGTDKRERKPLDANAVKRATIAHYVAGNPIPEGVTQLPEVPEDREAERRAMAVAAHYAAGHPVPAEVASLPDPSVSGAAWRGHTGGSEESAPWCDHTGAPVNGSDTDGIQGKCPECRGVVDLSDKGEIPKHRWYGVKISGTSGLSSKSIAAVEHGSVPGSPADADKRRVAESRCDRSGRVVRKSQGGTKKCTGCKRPVGLIERERTVKGERVTVWIYPNHVRDGDSFRHVGGGDVRKVTPRGTGADAAKKGTRGHGSVDGSANTGRVNLPPVRPERGWLAIAGTSVLSMSVRPGVDSGVTGKICPVCEERVDIAHRGMSRAARRRHSQRVAAWHTAQKARRDAKAEREIAKGERLPAGARKAARKAASTGSFAEGTLAATGTVVHGGKRPEVAPRVKPVGQTRAASK